MPIIDLFSKRQKKVRGETPDVYSYDDLPNPLRVQIVQIGSDKLGTEEEYYNTFAFSAVKDAYDSIVRSLRHEYGVFRYYQTLCHCWDGLLLALPVLRSAPECMRTHDLPDPNPDGYQDHLLFWPIGQELLAEASRQLLDQANLGDDADVAAVESTLRPLAEIPWNLHGAPWCYLLLVPTTPEERSWRIRNEDRKLALDVAGRLIRWMVGLDGLDEDDTTGLRQDWKNLLYPEPPQEDRIEEMWLEIHVARAHILTNH